jgi:ABC-type molybdate transport system permease subunit
MISPSEKVRTRAPPMGTCRQSQIFWARAGLEFPVKTLILSCMIVQLPFNVKKRSMARVSGIKTQDFRDRNPMK